MSNHGSTYDVCLVTTGHLSTNPRLVKEMHALRDTGYTVMVIACRFLDWADAVDADIDCNRIARSTLAFGPKASIFHRNCQRIRQRLSRIVAKYSTSWVRLRLSQHALHPVSFDLNRESCRIKARLYIAHNLAALPAAYKASRRAGGLLGFDAEDFHSGEYDHSSLENNPDLFATQQMERYFIPKCDYVTAASDGIGARYAELLNIPMPRTILNVFLKSDRDMRLSDDERTKERPVDAVSLYWFSQTIGPQRGLELIMQALVHLPKQFVLSLRGQWAAGYRNLFLSNARQLGVDDRVLELAPCRSEEMVARAACHDIGLALEMPHCENRDLCVTNKLFTYLNAGIPCVLTDTVGQRPFAERLPAAVRLIDGKNAEQASESIAELAENLQTAKQAARTAGDQYCWENERPKFLTIVESQIGQP